MALAMRTGIAPAAWLAEGGRVIATAWDLLDEAEQHQQHDQVDEQDGRQYSG